MGCCFECISKIELLVVPLNLCMQNIGVSQFEFGLQISGFCREFVGFLWLHERPKINSPQIVGADIFDILHFMEFPAKFKAQRSQRIRTPLIRKGL